MNQANQGNNGDAPPNMPVKRKRGRPRKDQNLNRREALPAPPGFGGVNGNQPHQVVAIQGANENFVGQAVTGVVEAAFDAGYLLSVKIGNSNTSLRGVVFKPGHYVPLSAQNDVAPHAQMIRRNEIPFPTENKARVRRRRRRSRESNEQHGNLTGHLLNGPPLANHKHVSPVVAYSVPFVGSRGTVVPVVLQPVTMANGLPLTNQVPSIPSLAGHIAAPNHKQVEIVKTQALPSQPQTSHQVTPEQNDNSAFHRGSAEALFGEVKSMKQTGVSTPNEAHKRVRVSSQSLETQNSMAAGKSSVEDSGEGDSDDTNDEPLDVEPLQAIHSNIRNQSGPVPMPPENVRIGRMSELLQALQENMTENQMPRVENMAAKGDLGK